jgi:hypothetical protein
MRQISIPRGSYQAHPDDSKSDERDQLEENPRFVVLHVKEYRVLVTEGIDRSQYKSGDQRAEERSPQRFQREIIADLNTKQHKMIASILGAAFCAQSG